MLLVSGVIVLLFIFLSFRLGSLVGLDSTELATRNIVNSNGLVLLDILRNAVMLPYNLGLYILQFLPLHGAGSIRIVGVVAAVAGVVGMYYLIRQWHSQRVAILGTALFATSPWLLHTSRYAEATSIYAAGIAVFALWAWTQSARRIRTSLLLLCIACGMALYIPGFVWFVVPAIIWQRHNIVLALRRVSLKYGIVLASVGALMALPLILSIAWPLPGTSRLDTPLGLLGIPETLPTVQQFLQNALTVWKSIFIISDGNPVYFVGKLPFISIFGSIMFVIGVIVFATLHRLSRTRVLATLLIGGTILVALAGSVPIAFLLPFVYLIIAEGISQLLREWLRVFPLNPIARGIGVTLVTLAVISAIGYQLATYFVAWPHTKEVQSRFTHTVETSTKKNP